MQSQYQSLKKKYTTFHRLKDQSGFGWSSDGVPTADDSVWDAYIRQHKDAAEFRNSGFPFYEQLHEIFSGTVATGHYAFSGASRLANMGSISSSSDDGSESDSAYCVQTQSSSVRARTSSDTLLFATPTGPHSDTSKDKNKKRKRKSDITIAEAINNLAESNKQQELTEFDENYYQDEAIKIFEDLYAGQFSEEEEYSIVRYFHNNPQMSRLFSRNHHRNAVRKGILADILKE